MINSIPGDSRRLCSVLMIALCLSVPEQSARAEDAAIDFDIPAQPLAMALEQYNAIAGRNTLYSSNLALGRRSAPVRGQLLPGAALAALLEGTGLAAREDSTGSTVILRTSSGPVSTLTPASDQFYRQIQLGLQAAMCADADARPGDYVVAFRLWIDPAGRVARYERGSSGQANIDEGIDRALRRMRIDAKPPADLAQPIFVAIQPKAPGVTMGCDQVPASSIAARP